jgi:hypothetical protein
MLPADYQCSVNKRYAGRCYFAAQRPIIPVCEAADMRDRGRV